MTRRRDKGLRFSRRHFVVGVLLAGMTALAARSVHLQVLDREFLREEGDARHLRVVKMSAHRGMITDRNGEPLAISTPVDSVWANPGELMSARERLPELARLLGVPADDLWQTIASRADREFVYLRRHINPDLGRRVLALELPGVALQREYRRFYPLGEVAAHLIGFTNVDDHGQEGLELAWDAWLSGEPGLKRVVRDRLGRIVKDVEQIRPVRPGHDLRLSIDSRLQYLAYRELKKAVERHRARAGSIVLLDPHSGEVLAMVNQPSYNPNNRKGLKVEALRNRAVTDVFEPGSTVKPFVVAAALESGRVPRGLRIDTSPGYYRVSGHLIRDDRNNGRLDLAHILIRSSNVGASKLAMRLPSDVLWQGLSRVGFGQATGSGFPGERSGLLNPPQRWRKLDKATLAFGYGLSVTALQLAQAYSVLAADGVLHPAHFVPGQEVRPRRVMRAATARSVRAMLRGVISDEGTARRAAVPGYSVAGKTGTVHKAVAGGYAEDRYVAIFAGMAPADDPRLVAVVVIDEPQGDYYGGKVAAPVFSRVMQAALRVLNVAPDAPAGLQAGRVSSREGAA